jgi:aldose 1-epimerase
MSLKQTKLIGFTIFVLMAFYGCKQKPKEQTAVETEATELMKIKKSVFGTLEDGTHIDAYTLINTKGMEVKIISYGGRIVSLSVPDKNGSFENVTFGFDNIQDYVNENPFFGALVGRYGNRIAKGKFSIDGNQYTLVTNNGENHLHGGTVGFDKIVWDVEPIESEDNAQLELHYVSKDGEEGYPGKLEVTVMYTLNNDNELSVEYKAETDKPTVVNLTQHAYFNLSGDFSKDVLQQEVVLHADRFLPVDAGLIPTGELRNVSGTPFDFTQAKAIGKDINQENNQLKLGGGYDHCWVLNGEKGTLRKSATAYDPTSGRFLEVFTTEPGIQFYTGNFLDGSLPIPGNERGYGKRSGFCLETQHYPDSPNQPEFPSTRLNPGETYETTTKFKFSTK